MDRSSSNWRKATYSNGSGDCVEVGGAASVIMVRDTEDRDGGTLTFTAEQWQAFTTSFQVASRS